MKASITYHLAVLIFLTICVAQSEGNAALRSTPDSPAGYNNNAKHSTANINPNTDNANTDNTNTDNTNTDNANTDNANTDNTNTDNANTDNANTDNANTDNANTDNANTDNTNTDNDNTLYFRSAESLVLTAEVKQDAPDLLTENSATTEVKQNVPDLLTENSATDSLQTGREGREESLPERSEGLKKQHREGRTFPPQAGREGQKDPQQADWGGLGDVGRLSRSLLDVPWWPFFLTQVAYAFRGQRRDRKNQFGAVFMARVDDLSHFYLDLQPHNKDGTPAINNTNTVSPDYDHMRNFVASRSEDVSGTMLHAVDRLLKDLRSLSENYHYTFVDQLHQKPANLIVLYWWIMPSPDCVELITCHLNHSRFANFTHKVLVYTEPGTPTLKYMTKRNNVESIKALNDGGIEVFEQTCDPSEEQEDANPDLQHSDIDQDQVSPTSSPAELPLSHDDRVCKQEDTLQGCMVDCLDRKICCSCKDSGRKAMTVALVNKIAKQCATSDIRSCAKDWIKKTLDYTPASTCVNSRDVKQLVNRCTKRCIHRPLSKPLLPKSPFAFPGLLSNISDLSNLPDVDLSDFCQDMRADGFLCATFRADSFTVGNTLCRSDNRCSFKHHGYSETYSWCYVDWHNHWDYCCTGSCGYHAHSYMWCSAGSTWQYCGKAGHVTVDGRRCLAEFPCGMHQEDGTTGYYWCYTDLAHSWGRCCQPGTRCGKKGSCFTGFKKNTCSMNCPKTVE